MLRFTTAGESHGPARVSILEGRPAGGPLRAADAAGELARRQQGYGRGRRMQIERDSAEFLSGVRAGETIGSPIAMLIRNRDWANWQEIMDPAPHAGDAEGAPRRGGGARGRPGAPPRPRRRQYDPAPPPAHGARAPARA
ncbi:MAG: chorismate synthase, partial [Gemmatimonadaceae bacterium]|nr:chorismate synthase [Gemmatimonadaceae bacterium]